VIIALGAIEKMFEEGHHANHLRYTGNCYKCNLDTEIVVTKTSGGYGLWGGILYHHNPQNILILCSGCYEEFGHLILELEPDTGTLLQSPCSQIKSKANLR
jgi:hypothetical protein